MEFYFIGFEESLRASDGGVKSITAKFQSCKGSALRNGHNGHDTRPLPHRELHEAGGAAGGQASDESPSPSLTNSPVPDSPRLHTPELGSNSGARDFLPPGHAERVFLTLAL